MTTLTKQILRCVVAGVTALAVSAAAQADPTVEGFKQFLKDTRAEAIAAGVKAKTYDTAVAGLEPDFKIPDLVMSSRPQVDNAGQAEFTKTAADYIKKPYMEKMAAQGRQFFAQHRDALMRIEKTTGVDPYIVVAIWGRETAYGTYTLPHDAIRVLATLAYAGRRADMFKQEFIAAIRMLDAGVARSDMRSSWAGAVGLTQFMPTEYFKHAADGDGDGKIDLWRSVDDALASAAKQLQGKGWVRGSRWGREVVIGPKADCGLEGPPDERTIADWAALGFKPANGKAFAEKEMTERAYLMSPAGTYGPAFLAGENFKVIRLYNTSDLYALFVGHLSDRIRGGGDFTTPWASYAQPKTKTVHDLQARLKDLGYPMDKTDGKIGSNTRKQIGLYQRSAGLTVDCWPSDAVLAHAVGNGRAAAVPAPGGDRAQ